MPINPNETNNEINNKKNIYQLKKSPSTRTPSPPISTHLTILSSTSSSNNNSYNNNINLNSNDKNIMIANPSYELLQCTGCKNYIEDKYVLNLENSYWHETCLTCSYCGQYLQNTCYHKNMQLYCKDDYLKLFGAKCNSCNKLLLSTDLVMRTSFGKIFHSNCFKCSICERHLKKGDEYLLNDENIFCKYDYELLKLKSALPQLPTPTNTSSSVLQQHNENENNNDVHSNIINNQVVNNSNSSFNSTPSDDDESFDDDCDNRRTSKRPRTILTSSQRRKFRDAFGVSQKPCRKVREQLASETGLSVRVVQVWFQNERAKMKKLQRRQQPTTNANDSLNGQNDVNEKLSNRNNLNRLNKNNKNLMAINHDDEDLIDDDSETCSDDENESITSSITNNNLIINNNNQTNIKQNAVTILNATHISNSSSPSSNSSLSSTNTIFQQQPQQQFQPIQNSVLFNCDNNEHQHLLNQEFSNNYYNPKECNKLLSLCDFNSNIQSSGPSSSSSSSSSLSFCSASYFTNTNLSENNIARKDEQNPIDRLYSMQNSYFCSKC